MLNGNIGIIKSMIAEITDSTNIARAYGLMPIAWSTGTTLGYDIIPTLQTRIEHFCRPMIGGFLLKPAERYPAIFGQSEFLKKYPYFLPCAVPATYSLVAWLVTYFYLKEVSRISQTRITESNLFLLSISPDSQVACSHHPALRSQGTPFG